MRELQSAAVVTPYVPNATATLALGITNAGITYTPTVAGTDGNLISVSYIDPGAVNQIIRVVVSGKFIRVYLATNSSGVVTSTATLVKTAIDALPAAAALVTLAQIGSGAGVVIPVAQTFLAGGTDTAADFAEATLAIIVATTGVVSVRMVHTGDTVVVPVTGGVIHRLCVDRIYATGTSGTGAIVRLW